MLGAMSPAPGELYVESVHRYPVKSMQGELPEEITFRDGHVLGDRQWAVVDPETGFTLSAKRHGALLEAFARITDEGEVVIAIPGGSELAAADPATPKELSEWLGRAVELRQPGEANLPYELLADALDSESEVISFAGPESHFADAADAHLLTGSSLRAAAGLHSEGDWDVRRFRPTVVIEGAGEGFAEDLWIGSMVTMGTDVRVEPFMPTIRCSMPPRAQPGLPRDNKVARVLKDEHNFCLGIYAAGRADGTVRRGDPVVLAPPTS
jgi:uncharacterized protein YcbX